MMEQHATSSALIRTRSKKITTVFYSLFSLFKNRELGLEALNFSKKCIDRASMGGSYSSVSEEEYKRLFQEFVHFFRSYEPSPLTVEQVYALTVITTIFYNFSILNQKKVLEQENRREMLDSIVYNIHHRFNGLSLSSVFRNSPFMQYVLPLQKKLFQNAH